MKFFPSLAGMAAIASAATIPSNSTASGNSTAPVFATTNGTAAGNSTGPVSKIDNKVLILARDSDGANSASAGLLGYGIPFEAVLIPKEGGAIPTLNTSTSEGKYSGIIVIDALAYDYGATGWRSAVTDAQWSTIWAYQAGFKVRMVRINEFPGPLYGVGLAGAGGCCDAGVEQLISFTNTSLFPTANLKANAGITSQGLYHYPAVITDPSTTTQAAKFGPGGSYSTDTVAAVVNKFPGGREQFVWFTSWAPSWSATSNYLQHAHIHWMTRGIFLGKRKTHLSAQVDDVQLATDMYYPNGSTYKTTTADLDSHITWMADLNTRLPAGSSFKLELGHNGNGDIENATASGDASCKPAYAVEYNEVPDTPLEFQKPLGTGVDRWPAEFTTYPWSLACAQRDTFARWFGTPDKLNAYMHMSHTFSHMELNNATYKDAKREIEFNQAWMKQNGIANATSFSAKGLIPPAITGTHNGDVIRAWMDAGLTSIVGDNTRPVLRNPNNKYWPLTSTVAGNGHAGLTIVPRYSTAIYYNCDTPECNTKEWIDTSGGKGTFADILALSKADNTRYLFGLQSDPYMFHQANMRLTNMPPMTVGSKTMPMSILMAWTETVAQEMARLTNWPVISLKHDDIAQYFLDRQALDGCQPSLSYGFSPDGSSVTSVTVAANGNSCPVPVPVTIPGGSTTATGGSVTSDQVGSEPPIQWVKLSGQPVTLKLSAGVTV
ncbi:hypothetical protein KVR01_007621 [Diaporthe batatas]|uniref:uncharacterized protein n=1 Tax=Diaporthe batatas TaxID=748121 RepID=UPI001D041F22|nr:uncharacterized protein KVR01_007621 [Diaporthe batatas]KAG8163143.1 hypothetical protein KVR01_007621 [Diaporthe batatas]